MEIRSGFHQSLDELQQDLLEVGRQVEHLLHRAVESLAVSDETAARMVIAADDEIDERTLQIEQRCLHLIALQQPMATDLRVIGMALKIAVDLERIADHAVEIAETTIRLAKQQYVKPLVDIPKMAEIAKEMLRDSLAAYMNRDVNGALSLAIKDDEADQLYAAVHRDILELMGNDPEANKQLVHLLLVAHNLERIADHATNIGEGVIFLVTGKRKNLNR